ncbi:putative phage abortive infection protein [Chryseobacterium sp. CP-77]|uniref:putative phage abortive infection protein n=1 Tax=Chryseobacterium sp. CP-77 TaxID=3116594 RepID=UPI002ED21065
MKSKIILGAAISLGLLFTLISIVFAARYFYDNQLFPISEKYNTKELNDLNVENDTVFIRQIASPKTIVIDSTLINPLSPGIENFFQKKVRLSKKILSKKDSISKNNSAISKDVNAVDYYIIQKDKESFQLGDIGDFLGGYFGVLLGFAGIAFTFIAFYVQYIANIEVQKQFRLQQFETQFQKLIDIYLNNKDKFEIIGYKNPDNLETNLNMNSGTNLLDKLKFILIAKRGQSGISYFAQPHQALLTQTNNNRIFIDYNTKDQIVFQKMLVELKCVYRVFLEAYKEKKGKREQDLSDLIKKELFSMAYKTFFKGLNKFSKEYLEDNTISTIDEGVIKYSFSILKELRSIYKLDGTKAYQNFYKDSRDQWKTLWLKVNYEPFKGYLHFLPQYYRNLYTMVKFVVNDNSDLKLNDEDKLKYLRILRSTMSDYEQAMLFYNWYSGIGDDWENSNNKFLSKYKMIHNMKKITLIDPQIDILTILGISSTANFFENY